MASTRAWPALLLVILTLSVSVLSPVVASSHLPRPRTWVYPPDVANLHDSTPSLHTTSSSPLPSVSRSSHDVARTAAAHPAPPFRSAPPPSAVQPSDVWNGTIPHVVCYSDRYAVLFVALATPNLAHTILAINTTTGQPLANLTLPPSQDIQALYLAEADPWTQLVWAMDYRTYTSYVLRIDGYGDVISQFNTTSVYVVFGVSGDGTRMLALVHAKNSGQLALVDALTGQPLMAYDGGLKSLSVVGGVLNPVTGDVWVADATANAVYGISPTNQLIATVPLASPFPGSSFAGFAVTNDGTRAFLCFDNSEFVATNYTLLQLDIASKTAPGTVLSNVSLASWAWVPSSFAPTNVPGELYVVNSLNLTVALLTGNGSSTVSRLAFGTHPALFYPSALATLGDRLYVVTGYQGFTVLTVTGELIGAVDVDECFYYPYQNVAVTGRGSVLLPLCNGTLLEYSDRLELIRTIGLDGPVLPHNLAMAGSEPNTTSVWLTDDANPTVLSRYSLQTGKLEAVLQGRRDAVFSSVAVDLRNGSVWAADSNTSRVYHWSRDGALLSLWDLSQPNATITIVAIAVDSAHDRVLLTQQWMSYQRYVVYGAYVVWLDAATGAVVSNYTFAAPERLGGVAVSADGSRVYAAAVDSRSVLVFDQTATGKAQNEPLYLSSE